MKYLITGGNGQLGREWTEFLQNQGLNFLSLSSADLDITDKQALESQLISYQPDVVINCAAYTKVDQAEEDKQAAFSINATAVSFIAELCNERSIKLVHYSTDYIFAGNELDHKLMPNGYPEDHEPDPINTYGASKLQGEQEIQNSGCSYLIIRVSWLCGQYGHNFIKTMLRLGKEYEELKVVNDQYGCPTFANNVVDNTFQLLKLQKEGIFHLTSEGEITWYDLAKEIFLQSKTEINVIPVSSDEFPAKAKRPAFSLLNTNKIKSIKGINIIEWKPGLNALLKQLNEN